MQHILSLVCQNGTSLVKTSFISKHPLHRGKLDSCWEGIAPRKQGRSECLGLIILGSPVGLGRTKANLAEILSPRSLSQLVYWLCSDSSYLEPKAEQDGRKISPQGEMWLLSTTFWGATSLPSGQLKQCKTGAELQSSSSLRNILWMNHPWLVLAARTCQTRAAVPEGGKSNRDLDTAEGEAEAQAVSSSSTVWTSTTAPGTPGKHTLSAIYFLA